MRRRIIEDTRLDWRDPSMPVLRGYNMPDGSFRELIDPEYETRYRAHLMKQPGDDYYNDPTYNLRRKR